MGKYSNSSRSFNTLKHSNRVERSKRKVQSKYLILSVCVVVIAILLALAVFLVMASAHSGSPAKNNKNEQEISYTTQSVASEELYKGDLQLVNKQHKYRFLETSSLVPASSLTTSGVASSGSILVNKDALAAFDSMMKKYVEINETSDVYLTEAYRTEADQVGKQFDPGYSDHHTGRLLTIKQKNGNALPSDHWLYQNCYKYGFVVRYPSGKSAYTGVSDYTYAFRYVGVAHATYMQEHNLCMEEYITLLQNNYASGDLLRVDAADGSSYTIYYLRAVEENATVSLPSGLPYTASGDNTGGYIVTVNLGKTATEE